VGVDGFFLVYSVSLKNEERFLQDQQSGAKERDTGGVPSCSWMWELMIEGRMVQHLKILYSRKEQVLEETECKEGVEAILKKEKS
jgi:hypothetical protein